MLHRHQAGVCTSKGLPGGAKYLASSVSLKLRVCGTVLFSNIVLKVMLYGREPTMAKGNMLAVTERAMGRRMIWMSVTILSIKLSVRGVVWKVSS